MGNGIEQDVREIRHDVRVLATEGCAHKESHDLSINKLWGAVENEKKERGNMFIKTIILVTTIVVGAMIANIYATSSVVEQVIIKTMAAEPHK